MNEHILPPLNASIRGLFLAVTIVLSTILPARAAVYFSETFDEYAPTTTGGTAFTSNTYLQAVNVTGSTNVYNDLGGAGTVPNVALFQGGSVATFLNVNNAYVGTTNVYQGSLGAYTVNFVVSLQDATPANPFAGTSFMELRLRQSSVNSDDGLTLRIYGSSNPGLFAIWNGPASGNPASGYLNGTGLNGTAPFSLSVVDTGAAISVYINGSTTAFTTLTSNYGAGNAGYISFGDSNYTGLKVDSMSVVPEPSAVALIILGMGILLIYSRRTVSAYKLLHLVEVK